MASNGEKSWYTKIKQRKRDNLMLGRNHLVTGVCSMALAHSARLALHTYQGPMHDLLSHISDQITTYFTQFYPIPIFAAIPLAVLFYGLGLLLPDIDDEHSMLGRFIHLPVEHHGITHTFWVFGLLSIAGFFFRPLAWLMLGYAVHLFWDSLGACGVCFFYPISHYLVYDSGKKVKKGHVLKLYHTGKASEYVVVAVVMLLTAASVLFSTGMVHL